MERVAGCTVGVKDSPVGVKPRAQHELTLPEVEWGTMDTCRPLYSWKGWSSSEDPPTATMLGPQSQPGSQSAGPQGAVQAEWVSDLGQL